MSLVNPCNLELDPINTGVESDTAMRATSQIWIVPSAARFTLADIAASPYNGSFTAYAEAQMHLSPSLRWYPLFGYSAPISKIDDNDENDIEETMDDGSIVFVRYGKANRTFYTTKGGERLAAKLMQLRGNAFIEADIDSKIKVHEPSKDTFGGFPLNMLKGLSPELAGLKTAFKNKLRLSFDKVAYIVHGRIFQATQTENILDVKGLMDVKVSAGTQSATTSAMYVTVKTECAETDFAVEYPGTGAGTIGQVANFVVTKVSDGSSNTPSGVTVQNGEVKLAGTFSSGQSYKIALAAPATLKTNGLPGYEGITYATVAIP
jgi:hypothetical protein